jgi:nucleoid-associated protein YgaU
MAFLANSLFMFSDRGRRYAAARSRSFAAREPNARVLSYEHAASVLAHCLRGPDGAAVRRLHLRLVHAAGASSQEDHVVLRDLCGRLHRGQLALLEIPGHEGVEAPGATTTSPEEQELSRLLSPLGARDLSYRGDGYRLVATNRLARMRGRDGYEVLSAQEARRVLPELAAERARPAELREALTALQAWLEAHPDDVVLLRRHRVHFRELEKGPATTPSQLRKTLHYITVEVVDDAEKPVAGVAVQFVLADGDRKSATTNEEGLARLSPVPAGNAAIRLPNLDGSAWSAVGGGSTPASQGPARVHIVKRGDTLARIAHKYGLKNWKAVWNAAENEALRAKRKNPNVLYPGDEVKVAGNAVHEITRPTDQVHRIVLKPGTMVTLRLNLLGHKRKALADVPCKILVRDQVVYEGTVKDGKLECQLPASVTDATLIADIDGLVIERPLHIGALDPVDQVSGVQARLSNLGWYRGEADGVLSEALHMAQNTFREAEDLESKSELDSSLHGPLQDAHLV